MCTQAWKTTTQTAYEPFIIHLVMSHFLKWPVGNQLPNCYFSVAQNKRNSRYQSDFGLTDTQLEPMATSCSFQWRWDPSSRWIHFWKFSFSPKKAQGPKGTCDSLKHVDSQSRWLESLFRLRPHDLRKASSKQQAVINQWASFWLSRDSITSSDTDKRVCEICFAMLPSV